MAEMSREDFWYTLDNVGIGYAITSYFGRENDAIPKELRETWTKAYDAIHPIEEWFLNNEPDA